MTNLIAMIIPSRVFRIPFSMKRLLGEVAIPGLGQEIYKDEPGTSWHTRQRGIY